MDAVRLGSRALVAIACTVCLAAAGCEGRASNDGNFAFGGQELAATEVDGLLVAAVSQAEALGVPAVAAVVDREGEVLGVFVMAPRDVNGDAVADALTEANVQAAIAKASTAAFFASEQNAFTTRTAYFIVQGHFPPGVQDTAAGPLFGVQDSSLVGSETRSAFDEDGDQVGAGITGELGGVPLYKNGAPVGGLGIDTADALRTLDGAPTLDTPIQNETDERIALVAARAYAAPRAIRSFNATVDGIALPYSETAALDPVAPLAPTTAALAALLPDVGELPARFPVRSSALQPEERVGGALDQFGVRPFHRQVGRAVARLGATALTNVPGERSTATFDGAEYRFKNVSVEVLEQDTIAGVPGEWRYPPIDTVEPSLLEGGLTAAEVEGMVFNAVARSDRASAGIRLPRGSSVRVHIAVVDLRGNILALFRMGDGTMFSADVAVQKARTSAFFSTNTAALSNRGIGFLSQPFFPPGIQGTDPGPLARLRDLVNRGRIPVESPPSLFLIQPTRAPNDGLILVSRDDDPLSPGIQTFDDYTGPGGPSQADIEAIRARLGAFGGLAVLADRPDLSPPFVSPGLQSGMQTFAGAVPLYKGGKLVGAIGVSGDGVDEDDLAAAAGAEGFEPPSGARCDELSEAALASALNARVALLATTVENHPDALIREIYGPLFRREANAVAARLAAGLSRVRIPYVRFPRNPDAR